MFSCASVALKASFNSADHFPASTHFETLDAVCSAILEQHPSRITLAERSGMGNTRGLLEDAGVFELAHQRGLTVTVLDELDQGG
jgi:uncharacterized protein (DUF362 family)